MPAHRVSGWGALVGLLLLFVVSAVPRPALALEPPARVSVLTMGPGEHPFTRFGHNALLLEWEGGDDAVYNFGTFRFDGWQGVSDFMSGRFRYWLSVGTLEQTLRAYGAARRSLTAQELSLTAQERAELFSALAENAEPERRYYDYDYYRDNCSTRVRDALDRLLHGELKRAVTGSGRFSFRQHTLRLVGDAPLLYFGLDVALGTQTNRAISRWEELFLPQELHDELARATRPDGDRRVRLVRAERVLLTAERAPLPAAPPSRKLPYSALGATGGLALAGLGATGARRRLVRVVFGSLTALLGLSLGLLGTALLVFSCSKHWAAHQNPSLLACPPWSLALVALGPLIAKGRTSVWPAVRLPLGASLLTSLCLLLLALTHAGRESARGVALFLPLWAGWLYGAWRACRTSPAPTAVPPTRASRT
jgi:hypothetical protein